MKAFVRNCVIVASAICTVTFLSIDLIILKDLMDLRIELNGIDRNEKVMSMAIQEEEEAEDEFNKLESFLDNIHNLNTVNREEALTNLKSICSEKLYSEFELQVSVSDIFNEPFYQYDSLTKYQNYRNNKYVILGEFKTLAGGVGTHIITIEFNKEGDIKYYNIDTYA